MFLTQTWLFEPLTASPITYACIPYVCLSLNPLHCQFLRPMGSPPPPKSELIGFRAEAKSGLSFFPHTLFLKLSLSCRWSVFFNLFSLNLNFTHDKSRTYDIYIYVIYIYISRLILTSILFPFLYYIQYYIYTCICYCIPQTRSHMIQTGPGSCCWKCGIPGALDSDFGSADPPIRKNHHL